MGEFLIINYNKKLCNNNLDIKIVHPIDRTLTSHNDNVDPLSSFTSKDKCITASGLTGWRVRQMPVNESESNALFIVCMDKEIFCVL